MAHHPRQVLHFKTNEKTKEKLKHLTKRASNHTRCTTQQRPQDVLGKINRRAIAKRNIERMMGKIKREQARPKKLNAKWKQD